MVRGNSCQASKLADLLKKRLSLTRKVEKYIRDEESRKKSRSSVNSASFRFFSEKVEYMMRNNTISDLVGVSAATFHRLSTICIKKPSKIAHHVRISIFLKFIREGTSQKALSREVGLSQPTLSRLISSCIHDICKEAPKYIKFPKTKAEIQTMTRAFADKTYSNGTVKGVPCFAVVDGKHWRCDHPPNTGSLNRNYKSFFSFNSLFVCDNDTRIIYAQISELGVNSDAQLFRCGILDELMERAVRTVGYQKLGDSDVIMPPFILGDNGFGLSKHVITPYRQNQLASSGHIKFNEIISGSRVKIENCFGILTSKFQIFSRNLRLDPKTSRALIVSASVIHNISLGPLEVSPENDDDDECSDPYRTPEEQRSALREYLLNR